MPSFETALSARELLDSWSKSDLINSAQADRIESFIINRHEEKELPLYLRALVGVGAFISSICFIGFLSVADIIDIRSAPGLISWGIVFIILSVGLTRFSTDKNSTIKHSFLMQSSFCLIGAGKILFVMGFGEAFKPDRGWGITLATLLITLATYHIYRMSIDRYLSALAVFTTFFFNIILDRDYQQSAQLSLNLLFLFQIVLAGVLFTNGKVRRDYLPLAYAVVSALCIQVHFLSIPLKDIFWTRGEPYSLIFINIIFTVALTCLIGWAADSTKKFISEPIIIACLGGLLLGFISAPGIILAICLMILGYGKHERLLGLLGLLLVPVFLLIYYYNLDVSLMAKSGILVGSGVVLLVGRLYLAIQGLDRRTAQ